MFPLSGAMLALTGALAAACFVKAFVTRLYRPLNRGILRFSRRLRAVQAGSIQAFLIYIFVTLLLLLLFAL